jgi:type I restriction enzyme, S subunit
VEFLERETGCIDRLIGKKRELIERLGEKRTALISRTATRGLPPAAPRAAGLHEDAPLKPSDLDWLGDIPIRLEAKRTAVEAIAQPIFVGSGAQKWAQSPNSQKTTVPN